MGKMKQIMEDHSKEKTRLFIRPFNDIDRILEKEAQLDAYLMKEAVCEYIESKKPEVLKLREEFSFNKNGIFVDLLRFILTKINSFSFEEDNELFKLINFEEKAEVCCVPLIKIDLNSILLNFLNEYGDLEDYQDRVSYKIEVLCLADPSEKYGIEIFSKIIEDSRDLKLVYFADLKLMAYLRDEEIRDSILNNIHLHLNTNCSLECVNHFYKLIKKDPELYDRLYLDKPAGAKILYLALIDGDVEIRQKAEKQLLSLKKSKIFYESLSNLLHIDFETAFHIMMNLALHGEAGQITEEKQILIDFMKENREKIFEYLSQDNISYDEAVFILYTFSKEKLSFNETELNILLNLEKRFKNEIFITQYIRAITNEHLVSN